MKSRLHILLDCSGSFPNLDLIKSIILLDERSFPDFLAILSIKNFSIEDFEFEKRQEIRNLLGMKKGYFRLFYEADEFPERDIKRYIYEAKDIKNYFKLDINN